MPQYFQDADGKLHEFPDDATPEEIDAATRPSGPKQSPYALQQRAMRGDQQAMAEYNARAVAAGQNTLDGERNANDPAAGRNNFWEGMGASFVNTGRGLQQLDAEIGNWLGFTSDQELARRQAIVDRNQITQAPLMDTYSGIAGNALGQVAQAYAGGAALAPFKAPAGASMLTRMQVGAGNGAIGGMAMAGTQPVVSGRTRIDNVADGGMYGYAGGAAGVPIGAGLSRVFNGASETMSPMLKELYLKAKAAGINVLPHQLSDSRVLKWVSSAVKDLPWTGAASANKSQVDGFTRAVAKTMGLNTDELSPTAMKAVNDRVNYLYNNAFDGVDIGLDGGFKAKLGKLIQDNTANLSAGEREQFINLLKIISKDAVGGNLPGKVYQELRKTNIAKMISGNKNNLGEAVKELRDILDETASRFLPPEKIGMFDEAQTLYRNKKVAENALAFRDTMDVKTRTQGKVNPATFESAIGRKYTPTQEVEDLGRIGQLIKDPAPQSGTVPRALASLAVFGGGGAFTPVGILGGLAGGIGAGRVVNSSTLARLIAEGVGDVRVPGTQLRLPTKQVANSVSKRIPPALALGSAGVSVPAFAEPKDFDAQLRSQVSSGQLTKQDAAAKLDAYLQMYSQQNGIESTRALYDQYPAWAEILNY